MKTWTARSHFDAPIERVFDLTTDPRRMQEMFPSIEAISDVRGTGDAAGDSFRFRDRLLGRTITGTTVVTAALRPILQTTETTYADGTRLTWTMRFREASGGTDVHNEVAYEPPTGPLSRLSANLGGLFVERRVRRSVELFERMLARPVR
jgi:ligand-binding SRPBCC domain-containing protein